MYASRAAPVLALALALLTSACGASSVCGQAENNAGGYSKIAMDDPDVVAAADLAAAEISGEADPEYELVCAQTQVVAGTNYRLGIDLEDTTWRAVVFEDFDGSLELTSSEEVQ